MCCNSLGVLAVPVRDETPTSRPSPRPSHGLAMSMASYNPMDSCMVDLMPDTMDTAGSKYTPPLIHCGALHPLPFFIVNAFPRRVCGQFIRDLYDILIRQTTQNMT